MTAAVRQMLAELTDLQLDALDGIFCQMKPYPAGSRVDLDKLVERIKVLPSERLRELAEHSDFASSRTTPSGFMSVDGNGGRMFELLLLGLSVVDAEAQYRVEQERVEQLMADGMSGESAWAQIRRQFKRPPSTEPVRRRRRRQ